MNPKVILTVALAVVAVVWTLTVDAGEDELDPYDMINFDHLRMKMDKDSTTQPQESQKEADVIELTTTPPENRDKDTNTKEGRTNTDSKDGNKQVKTQQTPSVSGKEKDQYSGRLEHPLKKEENPLPEANCPAQLLFQQFVTVLLNFVQDKVSVLDEKSKATDFCLHLRLTPLQLETLQSFRRDHSKGRVFSAHEVLSHAIHGAHVLGSDDPLLRITWLEKRIGITFETAIQVVWLMASGLCLVWLLKRLRFSLWNVFVLGFIVSIFMTWFRLYKGEVAKQHEVMMKDMPKGCTKVPEGEGHFQKLINIFRYYFTFQQDECITYYEHLIVDPILKVSPMEAMAVAVVQTLLRPLRIVGTEFSEFLRALVKDLPVQWQWFSVVFVSCVIAMFSFMICGYRIRVPFLLAIEPSHSAEGENRRYLAVLEEQKRQLQTKVATLEDKNRELQVRVEVIGASGNQATPPIALSQPCRSESQPLLSLWYGKKLQCQCPQAGSPDCEVRESNLSYQMKRQDLTFGENVESCPYWPQEAQKVQSVSHESSEEGGFSSCGEDSKSPCSPCSEVETVSYSKPAKSAGEGSTPKLSSDNVVSSNR